MHASHYNQQQKTANQHQMQHKNREKQNIVIHKQARGQIAFSRTAKQLAFERCHHMQQPVQGMHQDINRTCPLPPGIEQESQCSKQ